MKRIRFHRNQSRFSASRDDAGVPHITAPSWLDALYGLGYMHAVDRGSQLLFSRAIAAGTAAEEIRDTPELLETDRFFRRWGLFRGLDEEAAALPARTREQLAAYCEGVNDGLAFSGRSLPVLATGFEPRPWDERAIMLVGQLLSFGGLAIGQMQNERVLIELIHAGVHDAGLRELFHPRLQAVDFDLLRRVKIANRLSDGALSLLIDLPRLSASNAWAVAPGRSAGGAILCSDPHLEINRLPAIWYEAVLRVAPEGTAKRDRKTPRAIGPYVLGASLPGCPFFCVARNAKVAWGVTYFPGDTIDYFIEECRPGGDTGWQYRRGDEWLDFELRKEVIKRKGAASETRRVYYNEVGILDADPSEPHDVGKSPKAPADSRRLHLSVAWTGAGSGAGQAVTCWLDLLAAASAKQAMQIVRSCPQPTLSFVFADRDGHIGRQASGRFPVRPGGYDGLTPIPAWNRANHWRGWVASDLLPSEYDPHAEFVATANEERHPHDPHVAGRPTLATLPAPDYRLKRIVAELSRMHRATVAMMQELQYDVTSTQALALLPLFLPHVPAGPIRDELASWDGRFDPGSTAATWFARLYRNVLVEVFGHAEGIGWRRTLYLTTRAGFSVMFLTAADRLLMRHDSHWWHWRKKAELIRRAAEKLNNESPAPWSQINNFRFSDRYFGELQGGRLLGFASRPHAMRGNHTTIFQGNILKTATREATFAPSYHFIADMSTDEAWTNLPGGPSESRFSRRYRSDIPRWLAGKYKRLAP
jgi:penicillin amidase